MNRLPHSRFIPALVLCVAGSFASQRADATIDIFPKEVQIRNVPLSVHIINSGDRAEYVSISLRLLKNPGVRIEEETLEAVADIAQPALYAFPFQVTLAPGRVKKSYSNLSEQLKQKQYIGWTSNQSYDLGKRTGQKNSKV